MVEKLPQNPLLNDNSPRSDPVLGGPKTAKTPEDPIPRNRLLAEVDILQDLGTEEQRRLKEVILQHEKVFRLDGRLGTYPTKVEIPLKEGAKPVSLPPFPSSPAKRQAMDEQLNMWLAQGVIEPSKSPWGALVFIVYRNEKPQMVIDLQKLNEVAIKDEFPIPWQEDILQALSGSQWLSTLDALSGFTQLEVAPQDMGKLAFCCHRGLFHFRHLPFGWTNGPATFQWIMQGILAPFLWIFALVYIDDIVVFLLNFEDHLKHLDLVFLAIEELGITLSPKKCHLAYQSLLLLRQKVSHLGLSTHKEKVDAILQLDKPQTINQLQIFLGMMMYFSAYIPFYAWIIAPLFRLLKKGTALVWGELEQEAFKLSKEVLTNAPFAHMPYQDRVIEYTWMHAITD